MKVKNYKLAEICEIKTHPGGWNIKDSTNPAHWENGTIPFYQIKDIQAQTLHPEKKLRSEIAGRWKLPLTTENSLLLTTLGTIGKVFHPGIPKCAFASTIVCLEPNLNSVLPQFLYYYLQSQENQISKLAGGSTVPMLTKNTLSDFPISLPSIPEQKQILTKFQIVYNQIFTSEIHYQDNLQKIIQSCLKFGDLLFQKHRNSTIRIKNHFQSVCGRTPPSQVYPLQKKKVPLEVVRNYPHLRAKTNYFLALFRLRHTISKSVHDFFHQEGFYYIPTPIIVSNDTEGTGGLFNVSTNEEEPFFSTPFSFLTVSGQLHAEALAQGLGKVYTFSPCFRAEKSQTTRHLAEFWMVEPEITFADLNKITTLAEKLVKEVINYVLINNCPELEYLEKHNQKELISKLQRTANESWERVDYGKCIEILTQKRDNFVSRDIKWGMDLQPEHEKYLCQYFGSLPIFVINYPIELKAFYMKNNPDEKTVACFDLLFPEVEELVGGSVREDNYQILVDKAEKKILDLDDLSWYLDLRKYGYAPSGGFGLGLERLIMFISGTENIRDVIPFPRYPQHLDS